MKFFGGGEKKVGGKKKTNGMTTTINYGYSRRYISLTG